MSLQDYRNRLKVKAPVKPATPTNTLAAETTTNFTVLGNHSEVDEAPMVTGSIERDTSVTLPVLPLFNESECFLLLHLCVSIIIGVWSWLDNLFVILKSHSLKRQRIHRQNLR